MNNEIQTRKAFLSQKVAEFAALEDDLEGKIFLHQEQLAKTQLEKFAAQRACDKWAQEHPDKPQDGSLSQKVVDCADAEKALHEKIAAIQTQLEDVRLGRIDAHLEYDAWVADKT